uniref:Reverse transcriptase Ty1/copia-type domain-containing protein n=1 Tax=Tanacetum cinerariifolium TaxID=118510 RepID=A0A6L2LF27_TANCI|nr:hypothetical protein [Tanacetum cinerariifolium]
MGYYFYYPPENKIFVARNAEFFEDNLIVQEVSESHGPLKINESDEGLELIQEEDTQLSENTSKEHNEWRSSPKMLKFPLVDPQGYLKHQIDMIEYDKWLEAINTKMQSMKDNQVWILVKLPSNGRTVGSKWIFKKKADMDGYVHTFKARLVEKGYTKTYGVNYGKTFALIANVRAIRILLAIVTFYDYEIWQMDVKTAFQNGHLVRWYSLSLWKAIFVFIFMKKIPDSGSLMTRPLIGTALGGGIRFLCIPSTVMFSVTKSSLRNSVLFLSSAIISKVASARGGGSPSFFDSFMTH